MTEQTIESSPGLALFIRSSLIAVPVMLAVGFALSFDQASRNIRGPAPLWDYFSALGWAVVLVVPLLWIPASPRERKALVVLWIVRVGVALGLMLLYEAAYGLDAYEYFHRGMNDPEAWKDMRFGEGTTNIIGLASLHASLVPQSYHAMKVSSAAVGLLSVLVFYRASNLLLGVRDVRVLYALGLFPSVLFWGSIMGKDPMVMLGIAIFTYGIVRFYRLRRSSGLVIAALGLLMACSIRIWLAAIFVFPLAFLLVTGRPGLLRRLLFATLAVPAFLVSVELFSDKFRIETRDDVVERTELLAGSWARGGSGQELTGFSSIGSMLAFMPFGAFTALFRPLPGEIFNAFGAVAGLENAAVLLAIIGSLRRGRWRNATEPLVSWLILTIVVWAAIYGFASYQNLGTAFRFKVQVMPLLLLVIISLYRGNWRKGQPLPEERSAGELR